MPAHRSFLPVILLALLAAGGASPVGASTRRCQTTLAAAGRELLSRSLAILSACRQAAARGRGGALECLADPAVARRRAAAARRPTQRIRQACQDGDVAALAPGGDCAGATTVSALVACLRAGHDADAEALIAVSDAAAGPLSRAARSCGVHASRAVRGFALARLAALQQCKRQARLRAALPPGSSCADAPRTASRLARLRAKAAGRITSACDGTTFTAFGPPCDRAADAGTLAECLLSATEAVADGALATQHRDTGFCGDAADAVESRIDALLAQLTLAEKVAQMHGSNLGDGTWRTPGNEALGIPGFGMIDGPRGVSPIAGRATAFPVAMARGATWDPALEEQVGAAIGTEARARGASVLLAPVLNILRHPRWGRAQETYGEDTLHLGRMGVGFVRGAQRHVIASAKHFAANSIEDTRFDVDVSIDERTLREVYLAHFRMAVQEADAGSIMSAYNQVNGHYCAENAHLLRDLLKGEWGFQGFVESDWLIGTRSTAPSANAGLDIEMPIPRFYGAPLVQAVGAGEVPESAIDDAVRRILRAQLCFRLDTDPPVKDPSQVETPAHRELARQVAREGIVLLRNEAGALPLDRGQIGSLVVAGDLATVANLGDRGSSSVLPTAAVSPLEGIRGAAGAVTVTHVAGPPLSPADGAVVAAADAVVVVAGLTAADEGEGLVAAGDRERLGLSSADGAFITAVGGLNPRTVVVLEGGSAITMPWVEDVAAILMAWYPGVEGGGAIADVLFGDVSPSGRLPISFPVAEEDLPPFDNRSRAVTYGYAHGYRWLDREGRAPLFPFGFGLSYTSFGYANLRLSPPTVAPGGRVRVTVDVTNTGTVAGDEVVQLYVGTQGSRVDRDPNQLKAFARVHLAPGETRTVPLEVRTADLAFYDTAAGWEIEAITYVVRVGRSSRDLPLEASFAIAPSS